MTSDEALDLIGNPPPVVHATKAQRVWLWVTRICAPISVAALVIAAVAAIETAQQSGCINTNLGDRNGLTATQNQAQIDNAQSILNYAQTQLANATSLAAVIAATPGAAQDKAFQNFVATLRTSGEKLALFVRQTNQYVATLRSVQDKRNAQPLGQC